MPQAVILATGPSSATHLPQPALFGRTTAASSGFGATPTRRICQSWYPVEFGVSMVSSPRPRQDHASMNSPWFFSLTLPEGCGSSSNRWPALSVSQLPRSAIQ